MAEYIEREAERDVREQPPITQAIKGGEKSICWSCFHWEVCFAKENQPCIKCTRYITAADVLPRDEAIKMGAELAAMHGSDAASQQLEEAYIKGVEDGMTRRDVRPVARASWKRIDFKPCGHDYECSACGWKNDMATHFCPNCGAMMEGS